MDEVAHNSTAPRWRDAPLVFLPPPPVAHCPHCGFGGRHKIVRSHTERDGSVTRRCECGACNRRFIVVVELEECRRCQLLAEPADAFGTVEES